MDPATLASMAVSVLAPYLAKIGESVATQATEAAMDAVKAIFNTIKQKFAKDPYADQTLKHVEEAPDSKNWQAALSAVLEEKLKEDPAFAEALGKQLEVAKEAGAGDVINQNVSVSGQAKTGAINVVGKVAGGSVHLSGKP